ncbi:MAG: flagellar biosynthesis protein FlhB [Rhodobacteraceae bacterium]|nr:flagellar biosynthesis protein FlhB [Paracoccaceae bacterium]
MSDASGGGGEKTHDPTQKKLDDARRKGDVVRSTDLNATAAYLGLALALVFAGPASVRRAGEAMSVLLARADQLSGELMQPGGGALLPTLTAEILPALLPVLLLPLVMVLVTVLAQRAMVFSSDKLMPKLSRVSPVAVAKNRFGPTGLFEFAKSSVKLVILSIALGLFLAVNADDMLASIHMTPEGVSGILGGYIGAFLWLVFGIALVISIADYAWQVFDHRRKLMMSRQDIMDETRESEGDPHIRQQRRQMGYDIATQRMMMDVPKADVVIVNPTHYAVALKWNRSRQNAPVCVAKGVDAVAARIREVAAEAGVPIHRDPPAARALHAMVEIGAEIRPDHYAAVAAAIRYAEKVRRIAARRPR